MTSKPTWLLVCAALTGPIIAPAADRVPAAMTTFTYVANAENQTAPQVVYASDKWRTDDGGFLEGKGAGHRLLGNRVPGAGDFRIELDLALPRARGESLLGLGRDNGLTMVSGAESWVLQGKFFSRTGGAAKVTVPKIKPGQVFNLVVERQAARVIVTAAGRKIFEGPCPTRALTEVGIDPGSGTVQLHTFRASAHFQDNVAPSLSFTNTFGLQLRRPPRNAREVREPVIVSPAPSNECSTVARRDGAVEVYFITKPVDDSVSFIRSEDGGFTWSEPRVAFKIPGRAYYAIKVIETADGGLQAVYHVRGEGPGGYRGRLYEVYHTRQLPGATAWSESKRIVTGYVGSIRGLTQLKAGGRLVFSCARAIAEREKAPATGPDYGWHDVFVYTSDDLGETWQQSPDTLQLELHTKNNTRYGAIEPTPLELKDGRVWLLVRDRQGRLWQSFSSDRGTRWPALEISPFISSDSPAETIRLRDGRILLLTNACQFWANPRTYAMGGRDVLHASISADEGRTWSGFREILHETDVVTGGDRGTAYASAAETADGKIVVVSGQGEGKRAIVLLDPVWLTETGARDDLTGGPVGWTQYGGTELKVQNVDGTPALSIPLDPAKLSGASWNFPIADAGELSLRIRVPAAARSVRFSLNDHFNRIDDTAAADHAVFTAALPDAGPGDKAWRTVRFTWQAASTQGILSMSIDGRPAGTFKANRPAQFGLNYLRVECRGVSDEGALLLTDVTMKSAGQPTTLALAASQAVNRIAGLAEEGAVLGNGAVGAFDEKWATCPSLVITGTHHRMWYSSNFTPDVGPVGIGLARSEDGVNWRREGTGRPVFSPGAAGAFDSACVMGPEVIFDGNRYLMWYTGTTGSKHPAGFFAYRIGVASSQDGVTWIRENGGRPVIDLGPPGSPDEVQAATPSVLRERNGFRMWYAAWAPRPNHTICVAHSKDGITWERENGGKSVEGLNPATAFGPAVCRMGDDYVMLYMALAPTRAIYAARSKDGLRWQMLNGGNPVIVPSGKGFDADVVGHPFVHRSADALRVWYTGYQTLRGGVANWKLRIGLADAGFVLSEDGRRLGAN